MLPVADYEAQRAAFDALLAPACRQTIMLVSGESGTGKTTLLQACLQRVPKDVPVLPIQLRQSATSISEIFWRAGDRLDWGRLTGFTAQVAALQGVPRVQVDRNWLVGINNHIAVALRVENPAAREQRRAVLTQAWFDDLRVVDAPMLIAFDTYEDATPDVQQWIEGPFLARAARATALRVLVAGQAVPNPHNIEWGHCCTHHELYGVPEAAHWLPVVEALGRTIPVDNPRDWLAGVCHALGGAPDAIMQVIQGLPPKEVAA